LKPPSCTEEYSDRYHNVEGACINVKEGIPDEVEQLNIDPTYSPVDI